jgi:glutamyl-tRNA synthetase
MFTKTITRFAPSPSGYLHLGGARTAVFNYLYAKSKNGLFRLRIEDTDVKRSDEKMSDRILEALEWFGIHWDLEVVYQRKKIKHHRNTIHTLQDRNVVYPCFCTKEELEKNRKNFKYNGYCRQLSKDEILEKKSKNIPYCLRFKIPPGETFWDDAIHGKIKINNEELEDFIVMRSDNSPTYQLAVVVDDHDMEISDIIRGDDHISNTPKQILLYKSLKWNIPNFAHVPLILGEDKKRLSKRHGANSVEEYRDKGVLPQALFNYLSLLGWTPKNNQEILSGDQIIKNFSLNTVSNTSAVFDEKKIAWFNQKYLINSESRDLYNDVISIWEKANFISTPVSSSTKKWLLDIIELLKNRTVFVSDFKDKATYFFKKPLSYDEKGLKKYLSEQKNWDLLQGCREQIGQIDTFNEDKIEEEIREFAEKNGVAAGKIIHPLRLALTGQIASPGLFEIMVLLGKNEVLERLDFFINAKNDIIFVTNNGE